MADLAPGESVWSAPQAGEDPLREQAKTAWNMALAATILTMVSPCVTGVTLFAALPLGVVALSRGRRILEAGPDEVTEVYARTARTLGIAASAVSVFFLVMFVLVVVLYAGMIGVVILSEAAT